MVLHTQYNDLTTVYSQFLTPNFHYCDTFAFTYTINTYCIIIIFTLDPQLCFREINVKQKKKKKSYLHIFGPTNFYTQNQKRQMPGLKGEYYSPTPFSNAAKENNGDTGTYLPRAEERSVEKKDWRATQKEQNQGPIDQLAPLTYVGTYIGNSNVCLLSFQNCSKQMTTISFIHPFRHECLLGVYFLIQQVYVSRWKADDLPSLFIDQGQRNYHGTLARV